MTGREASIQRETRHLGLALFGVAAALVPFFGRAVQIDDPLFLWAARRIQESPFDFYGFSANWFGTVRPFPEVMQNPPLLSYWLAGWTAIFGWSEPSLHAALLPAALGALAATWMLARQLGAPPVESLVAAAATPAFFVSSTTVMCDVTLLCAWTWATVLWIRGIHAGRNAPLAGAVVIATIAALTKYVGVGLVLLFLAHGIAARRRAGVWMAWLLVPVAVLAAYELLTRRLYGQGLFIDAAMYASKIRGGGSVAHPGRIVSGLAFMGGAFLVALWYAPRLWSKRVLLAWCAVGAVLALGAVAGGWLVAPPLAESGSARGVFLLQVALLAAAGASVLWLVAEETWHSRSADALLLVLWVLGILVFAFEVNWSLNVRSLLPALPAVAVLMTRRAARRSASGPPSPVRRFGPLAAAALAAPAVAAADQRLAATARDAAARIGAQLRAEGRRGLFQGHWGFQWYAEREGLAAMDLRRPFAQPGDRVVLPMTNSNVRGLPPETVTLVGVVEEAPLPWLATMNPGAGAGFYADVFGPLPFVIGRIPPEKYLILEVQVPLRFPGR